MTLEEKKMLFERAVSGAPVSYQEVLNIYGNESNWKKLHQDGRCYWAWDGPTIVGYELAERTARGGDCTAKAMLKTLHQVQDILGRVLAEYGDSTVITDLPEILSAVGEARALCEKVTVGLLPPQDKKE